MSKEHSEKENHSTHSSHSTQSATDLSAHDLYFVCLHVANLVVTCEGAGVAPQIQRRLQRILDELIAEYDGALVERDDLEARFQK